MYKKRDARAKLLFSQSKPCRSRFRRRRPCLLSSLFLVRVNVFLGGVTANSRRAAHLTLRQAEWPLQAL